MISPVVDYENWALVHGIILRPIPCHTCGKEFIPKVPMALKGYRGLMVEDHGCEGNMPFVVVPVGKEELEIWESMRPEHLK